MRSSCVICADLYDNGDTVIALKCGHVFHENCINKWISQASTCPECRKQVRKKDNVKLFFNISCDDIPSSSNIENKIASLNAQLCEKNRELSKERQEKEEMREYVRIAEQKADNLQQEVYTLKSDATRTQQVFRDIRKKAAKVEDLENRNSYLMKQIQLYNDITTIIRGTQKDVDDVLESMAESSESLRNLVITNSLLKRELQNSQTSKTELRKEIDYLKQSNAAKTNSLSLAELKFTKLEENLRSLEIENARLLEEKHAFQSSSESVTDTVVFESPFPEREHRSSSDDSDVQLTPLSHKLLKNDKGKIKYKTDNVFRFPLKKMKVVEDVPFEIPKPPDNQDECSVVSYAYNGFGGHSKFINKTDLKKTFKPPSKRKKNKVK